MGRAILQLIRPASGKVVFLGQDLTQLAGSALRSMRRQMQIVFQDPRGSLNPRWTVGRIVEEPLRVHRIAARAERAQLARAMLAQVGLGGFLFRSAAGTAERRTAAAGRHRSGAGDPPQIGGLR